MAQTMRLDRLNRPLSSSHDPAGGKTHPWGTAESRQHGLTRTRTSQLRATRTRFQSDEGLDQPAISLIDCAFDAHDRDGAWARGE